MEEGLSRPSAPPRHIQGGRLPELANNVPLFSCMQASFCEAVIFFAEGAREGRHQRGISTASLFSLLSYLDAQRFCNIAPASLRKERNPTDVFFALFRMMQQPETNNGFPSPQHNVASGAADPDSDPEDDPGQLLNLWLGELNTLKKVS